MKKDVPAVVKIPAVSKRSLNAIGTPKSGLSGVLLVLSDCKMALSACLATSTAASGVTVMKLLIFLSHFYLLFQSLDQIKLVFEIAEKERKYKCKNIPVKYQR